MEVYTEGFVINLIGVIMGLIITWYALMFLKKMKETGALIWRTVGMNALLLGIFTTIGQFYYLLGNLYIDIIGIHYTMQLTGAFGVCIAAYFGSRYAFNSAEKLEEVLL